MASTSVPSGGNSGKGCLPAVAHDLRDGLLERHVAALFVAVRAGWDDVGHPVAATLGGGEYLVLLQRGLDVVPDVATAVDARTDLAVAKLVQQFLAAPFA